MQRLFVFMTMCVLATLCGCQSSGGSSGGFPGGPRVTLRAPVGSGPDAPGLFEGQSATFETIVNGASGPYSLAWNFGGAAPNTSSNLTGSGVSSVSVVFSEQTAPQQFTAVVTVTDFRGVTVSASVAFSLGLTQNSAPVIESLSFEDGKISVSASDADGDSLVFSAHFADIQQTQLPPSNVTATSAEFLVDTGLLNPADILSGANPPDVVVTVSDPAGATDTGEVMVSNSNFTAFPLEDDTLYAIATQTHASAGEPVRIVVATGITASPFQYLKGCGITCTAGAQYVPDSFDAGAIDENPAAGLPLDGVWADMGASGFLSGFQAVIAPADLGDGRERFDFNITPLGGSDITANGLLFNFELEFSKPGTYTLGFQDVDVVSRTYYQDSSAAEDHFWSDISNSHAYNTIVVE